MTVKNRTLHGIIKRHFQGLYILISIFLAGCSSIQHSEEMKSYIEGQTSVNAKANRDFDKNDCPSVTEINKESVEWKALVSGANSCIKKSNWTRLEILAKKLLEQEPRAPWGPFYLSVVAEQRNQIRKAEWMIDLAIKKMAGVGLLHYQKGRLHFKQDQMVDAMKHFKQALKYDSSLIDAHVLLGQIYLRDFEVEEAEEHFQSVLKHQQKNVAALWGLSECLARQEKHQGAVDLLSRLIDQGVEDVKFYLRRASILETHLSNWRRTYDSYLEIEKLVRSGKIEGKVDVNLAEKISKAKKEWEKQKKQAELDESKEKRKPANQKQG